MGRMLSTWLVLVRSFQVLGSFISGAMNGWLLFYLYSNRLGPSKLMLVLELLVATIFAQSLFAVLIIHTRQRSRRTAWIVVAVCFDVVLCFVDLTIVSLLSHAGLPSNCSGLTTSIWSKGDKADLPSPGSSTIRFSDEEDGHKGELDKFCSMERGFFVCAVLMMFAYILNIIMFVFRICDLNYTRNSRVQFLLDEREEILKLELKVQEQELRSQPCSPAAVSPLTFVTSRPTSEKHPAAYASIPQPTIIHTSSSSSSMPSSCRLMDVNLASIPESSAHQHTYGHLLPSAAIATLSAPRDGSALNLDTTDVQANLAMISDGSRYGSGHQVDSNQLPPYSPGNQRTMNGHGAENNDTRLSEYVKGETRAQDMKDCGTFQ